MKMLLKPFYLFLIPTLIISCNSKVKQVDGAIGKSDIELCVGEYLTEAEAVKKLEELSNNYSTADDWKARSKAIREHIYNGAELDKIPKENWEYPIKVIRGEINEMDGYSVENISLEMHPGYFVSGNLYRPLNVVEKIPAILCPHGHWFQPEDYGRFRPDMQLRSASLAKMGAVVFAWDMYGSGEDTQHTHHSPDALAFQCYNGIRILDFISSLDYVDTDRIGITGASGGGTQAFLISALDDRISVSVPTVMVSAHFYGGCVCESGMPIHKSGDFETNNVEIAASIAPKPLMIIGDGDDWTTNIPNVEFPYIKRIYELFDAADKTEYAYFEDEVHDYGFSKRTAAYGFLAKHLDLDMTQIEDNQGDIDEGFVTLLDTTQLKVYPDKALVKDPMH
jgi:dienelactone hydrolase